MIRVYPLIAILCCLFFTQCKKDKNKLVPDNSYGLPNATQQGKMIFACRMNENNWISENDIYSLNGSLRDDTISISGSPKTNGYFETLTFIIKGGLRQGDTYTFNNTTYFGRFSTNKTCLGYTGSSVTNAVSLSGSLTLTKLDRQNKIFSGTFNCIIPISGCDTLKITDGRFDVRYY